MLLPPSAFRLSHRLLVGVVLVGIGAALGGPDAALASGSILVDSTGDSDARDGVVTLREAILIANGDLLVSGLDAAEADNVTDTPGPSSPDTILFSSALFPPTAPQEIALLSGLPWMDSDGDAVDGTGAGVIIRSISGSDTCLTLEGNSHIVRGLQVDHCFIGIWARHSDNLISKVVLTRNGTGVTLEWWPGRLGGNRVESSMIGTDPSGSFALGNGHGIEIMGPGNIIGGPDPGDGNVISGNSGNGIQVYYGSSNIVQGNLIGTSGDGESPLPNGGHGVSGGNENAWNWTIVDNIISGNAGSGIDAPESLGWVIKGNRIGVSLSGLPLGNGAHGISRTGSGALVTIGGASPGDANIIAGNLGHGIALGLGGTRIPANIMGNYIGVLDDGTPVPNGLSGVYINAFRVSVGGVGIGEGNVIARNARYGVEFGSDPDVAGNVVRGNSIFANGLGGILIPSSTNQDVPPPVVLSAGSASGTACGGCIVDIYSDKGAQGQFYEGTAVADAGGGWHFAGPVRGPYVTATATDSTTSLTVPRGTSEFSAPFALDDDGHSHPRPKKHRHHHHHHPADDRRH